MDRKTLGLIGVGVALYFLLKKKKKEYILIPPSGCTDPGAVNYNPDSIEDVVVLLSTSLIGVIVVLLLPFAIVLQGVGLLTQPVGQS